MAHPYSWIFLEKFEKLIHPKCHTNSTPETWTALLPKKRGSRIPTNSARRACRTCQLLRPIWSFLFWQVVVFFLGDGGGGGCGFFIGWIFVWSFFGVRRGGKEHFLAVVQNYSGVDSKLWGAAVETVSLISWMLWGPSSMPWWKGGWSKALKPKKWRDYLPGGFNPSEKNFSKWESSPNRGAN